jgi:hypothetical protein
MNDFLGTAGKAAENILRFSNPVGLAYTLGQTFLGQYPGPGAFASPKGDREIGSKFDDPRFGTTYYAGSAYGTQTPGSFIKIDPTKATSDPREQAIFRTVQEQLRQKLAAESKPPATSGSPQSGSSTSSGGVSAPSPGPAPKPGQPGVSTEVPQKVDPQIQSILSAIERFGSLEYRGAATQQDLEAEVKRGLITNALAMRQSRENTRRQVELENIKAWRDLESTRIEANSRQAASLGAAVALSMQPNVSYMDALQKTYASAMAPYTNFSLKG